VAATGVFVSAGCSAGYRSSNSVNTSLYVSYSFVVRLSMLQSSSLGVILAAGKR